MSIDNAVANIIAASKDLSPAAIPVLRCWLRDQSGGAVSEICPVQLATWLSNMHPGRAESEHKLAILQVNYLAWLLPEFGKKKRGKP
jgi:hypothetical protein